MRTNIISSVVPLLIKAVVLWIGLFYLIDSRRGEEIFSCAFGIVEIFFAESLAKKRNKIEIVVFQLPRLLSTQGDSSFSLFLIKRTLKAAYNQRLSCTLLKNDEYFASHPIQSK